jgi:hypothetical protein
MITKRAAGAVLITALALPFAAAWAGHPPKLKEGLWDIRGRRLELPGDKRSEFSYKLCRDHGYDKAADAQLEHVKGCATTLTDEGNGKFSFASTCKLSDTSIVSNGVSIYASDKLLHVETHASFSPAFNGKTEETIVEDQQFLGKCPAAMRPGDTLPPDGIIRHHDRLGEP